MQDLPKYLVDSGAIEIREKLESVFGDKVLDVATESGDFILTLMNTLKGETSYVGVDISKKKWDSKKFENKSVKFIEMNAENLEFEDNAFDIVSISYSLHHLEKVAKVITEMKRVLKPGGYFLIQEMFCDGNQTKAQVADIRTHHWHAKIDTLLGISHNQTLTKNQLKEVVANLGLKELEILESSHPVKCLYCDDKLVCANPKDKDIIDFTIKEIDEALDRLNKHVEKHKLHENPLIEKLREEGEQVKRLTRSNGSTPASLLFFIGKKNNTT
ncbi:MAG: class I SAM-dependent methyltransferase [Candidatus Hodarchaeota archaeon]